MGLFESAWRPSAAMAARKWLREGATVEIFAENDWWDAKILAFNRKSVHIHYIGGGHPCPSLLVRVYPWVGFSCHWKRMVSAACSACLYRSKASNRCPAAPAMFAHGFQRNRGYKPHKTRTQAHGRMGQQALAVRAGLLGSNDVWRYWHSFSRLVPLSLTSPEKTHKHRTRLIYVCTSVSTHIHTQKHKLTHPHMFTHTHDIFCEYKHVFIHRRTQTTCIHTYIFVCGCAYVWICICMYVCIYIHVCMCIYVQPLVYGVWTNIYVHVHIHVFAQKSTHMYAHMHEYFHLHKYMYVYIYTHI